MFLLCVIMLALFIFTEFTVAQFAEKMGNGMGIIAILACMYFQASIILWYLQSNMDLLK